MLQSVSLFLFICLVAKPVSGSGNLWALLAAGSNEYYNYRHQADVCHAYQILHNNGFPDERIVVMMYDDIANNEQNPMKGKIINKPAGPDVYQGVPKDYTGKTVTAKNFLQILKGNKTAMAGIGSGKVIESGPDDYIFVNLVDHGAPGIFAFPEDELYENDLMKVLEEMHNNKRYKQMVIYMEACESGSMFDKIPTDWNIYVTTAANPYESSYACYYDGKAGEVYLGDVYSIKWMEDIDQNGTNSQSLDKQYDIVKALTTTSHVMQYGQMTFKDEFLKVFMGSGKFTPQAPGKGCPDSNSVPSYDVPIASLSRQIVSAENEKEKKLFEIRLQQELMYRKEARSAVERIAISLVGNQLGGVEKAFAKPTRITQYDCHKTASSHFLRTCPRTDYAINMTYVLANLCEMGFYPDKIVAAIDIACK